MVLFEYFLIYLVSYYLALPILENEIEKTGPARVICPPSPLVTVLSDGVSLGSS